MSILTSLGSITGGLGNSLVNSFLGRLNGTVSQFGNLSLSASKPMMDYQQQLARDSRRTYFQDNKYSLLEAGYNPLLAINGGASAQQLQTSIPSIPDLPNPSTAIQKMIDIKNYKLQKSRNAAEVNLINEQAENQELENIMKEKRIERYQEEINAEIDEKIYNAGLRKQQIEEAKQNVQSAKAKQRLDEAYTKTENELRELKKQKQTNENKKLEEEAKYTKERSRGYEFHLGKWGYTGDNHNPFGKDKGHWEVKKYKNKYNDGYHDEFTWVSN